MSGEAIKTTMTIEQVLQKLYDHEINCEIASFWDAGFSVRIGDEMNGFVGEARDCKVHEIPEAIVNIVSEKYPYIEW